MNTIKIEDYLLITDFVTINWLLTNYMAGKELTTFEQDLINEVTSKIDSYTTDKHAQIAKMYNELKK